MCFLELFCSILFIICFFSAFFIVISDGDLTLTYYDKFGTKLDELKGKVVWITGASTGIGAALAQEVAKHGAKIVITARSESKLHDVKQKCLKIGSIRDLKDEDVLVLPMDMCDFDKHKESVEKVISHFGKIDIMFHNAGRSQRARWEHTDLAVDKEIFDLNVFSVVNLSRQIMPYFLKQGSGTFSIVSSVAGNVGVPFSPSYTGSKHAVQGYFESLRTESLGTGINVCILCPGPVFSNLLEIAATENANEKFNGKMNVTDKRMTAERCARLCVVATAHKLAVSWIAFFPILPMLYFIQYMPAITTKLLSLLGPRYFLKLRDSKDTLKKDE